MQTIKQQIQEAMFKNSGKIYSAEDFEHIINKNSVKSILQKLAKEGKITRLINGLYTKLEYSKFLKKECYPLPEAVAEKIAQKFTWKIAPGGEASLNYTGVSTQVPNVYFYISDGPSREYRYRNKKITFQHTNEKFITSRSLQFAVLIEAIRILGKKDINKKWIVKKLAFFAQNIKEDLQSDTKDLTFWIRNVLLKIKEINDHRQVL
ncbi:Uncharacterised protein [Mycoplasmopsis citelli]|uniref:Transcriptional regulator, AbiEi antitoxin, Type IV TA system n=1 Tax=Mycoplasmopsis citelli TaxID=171281 RepID=A0A449B224_9BACT|nr:DUF6088 family protein [Mycoplasmopsis citelli]VEU74574.1 Uncharacterised protein [Mycoplasmopsis citelli]